MPISGRVFDAVEIEFLVNAALDFWLTTGRYADQFADFKRHTAESFAGVDALKARLQVDSGVPVDIRTRRWTPAEGKPVPPIPALRLPLPVVQKFEIDYVLAAPGQGARLTSWLDSFIYVDGAFRFFGRGASPSWSLPAQRNREVTTPKP